MSRKCFLKSGSFGTGSTYKAWAESQKQVAGQPNVNGCEYASLSFPLPSPSEQRRIVEILQQADALRQMRVESDFLADRILPALFHTVFGDPVTNPKGWPALALTDIADFITGATPSKENPLYWNGNIPWVRPKDMKQVELSDSTDHVSGVAIKETNLKLLPKDTALIVVRGRILAHTVPVCLARVPVAINQEIKGVRPKRGLSAEFLQWTLLAQQHHLLRLVSMAAHGIRKLDLDALGSIRVPVPPPSHYHLIEKWTRIVRDHQQAARTREAARKVTGNIWKVLLHSAFTGDLTAKWRHAQMQELLAEMKQQARLLNLPDPERNYPC